MEIIDNSAKKKTVEDNSSVNIQDILSACLANWKWFVLSVAVCLCLAVFYLLRTPSVYTRTASVLIKEDTKGQSATSEMDFSNLGLFQSNTNINNEIITMESPAIMQEVVRRLSLNVSYLKDGHFHKDVVYGTSLPLTSVITDLPNNETVSYRLTVNRDGLATVDEIKRDGESLNTESIEVSLGSVVKTPVGHILVSRTPFYDSTLIRLYVTQTGIVPAAASYSSRLSVARAEDNSSVINLSFKDVCIQRADDVLSTLISVYNENWVKDKNQIAVSTSVFINDRLAIIENELGVVDEDISSYKSKHMIPDLNAASSMYLSQSSETNAQILDLNNRLYMTRYIREHLADEANRYELLPTAGTESTSIESQISEYNTMLLRRNNLLTNSSSSNPVIADMDMSLDAMRNAIIVSLDNHMVMLQTQLRTLESTEQKASDRIAATPDQAKYLLSVERQQKVKEALYLFLLQKREENELSQAFTAYNTKIINPPGGSNVPVTPVRSRIVLIAFVLALIIPVCVIFLKEMLNTKVRGRKDVEGLSLPFAGEIPLKNEKKKKNARNSEESCIMVVEEGNRDMINEAFRVLRTNVEFMVHKKGDNNVVTVTSYNQGSGKTFITMNLAMALAIKHQRVIVVDGDLRHGSASRFVGSPRKGLSNWLAYQTEDYKDLIVKYPGQDNLHAMPIGTIPPNPTELISDSRMSQLINELHTQYDYIFIDCPPVDIVADTSILEKLSDRTLFIIRAGLLERSMLPELENLYVQGQYKNLSVVLNGTEGHGRYGSRYGYRYGYHTYNSYYNEK